MALLESLVTNNYSQHSALPHVIFATKLSPHTVYLVAAL